MKDDTHCPAADAGNPRHPLAKGITLVSAQVLPVMAIVSLFPAIPKLFAQFGYLPLASLLVPMILTLPSLAVALVAPFAGIVADRFGRRPIFLGGITAYLVLGVVPLFTAQLPLILASRALLGVAEACVVTVSSALIGDYFGEQRHRWVSMVGITITVTGTMLLVAGGMLAEFGWRGPFAVYLFVLPAVIMAWIHIDEPPGFGRDAQSAGKPAPVAPYPWREAALIGAVTLFTSLVYYVVPLNFAAVMGLVGVGSPARAGLLQAAASLAYLVGAMAYRHIHGWHVTRLLALAGAGMGVGMFVISRAASLPGVMVGATIQQLGAGLVIPVLMAWGQALLPGAQRARVMGIWVTFFFTGTFLCPPMITGLQAWLGGLMPAIGAAALVGLAGAAGAFALRGRQARTA